MSNRTPTFITCICALVLALGLSGCASSPSDADSESQGRRAAELNTQLGREYMGRGQYEIALEKLKKALDADNNFAPAHTMVAVLYETIGEDELAGKHYALAVKADPADGDVNNNYGAFLCRSGDARTAEPYFEKALEDPFYQTPAVALANAGSCAMEREELDKAERLLRQSLEYDAEFPDALFSLARLSYTRDDYMRARAFLQRYETRGAMTPESLMLGYRIESQLNNDEAVRRYRDELLRRFPASPETAEIKGGRVG